jgi:hypothetical protein
MINTVTVWVLFLPLLLGTLALYLPVLWKLHSRKFHLLMVIMLLTSYVCILASVLFELDWFTKIQENCNHINPFVTFEQYKNIYKAQKVMILSYLMLTQII